MWYIVPQAMSHNVTVYDAPVTLSNVVCTGSEESLIDCTDGIYRNSTNCSAVALAYCEGIIIKCNSGSGYII